MLVNIMVGQVSRVVKMEDDPKVWEPVDGTDELVGQVVIQVYRCGQEVVMFEYQVQRH